MLPINLRRGTNQAMAAVEYFMRLTIASGSAVAPKKTTSSVSKRDGQCFPARRCDKCGHLDLSINTLFSLAVTRDAV